MSVLTEEMLSSVYECQVVTVIDGDTLDLSINLGFDSYIIRRIRLLKIDAPEINNTKHTSETYKRGIVAMGEVINYFAGKEPPFYLQADSKGIYGRWLGELWRDIGEQSLNDYMISKGYYNGGWTKSVQQQLIEDWYNNPAWTRLGKGQHLGNESELTNRGN